VPSVPDVVPGVPEVAVPVPSAAAVVADRARVPARAQRGAAVRGSSSSGFGGLGDGTPGTFGDQAVESLYNMFDSASNWLNTLPAGPLTDFLQGALLLARRTILPYGGGVSLGQYNLPTEPARDFNTAEMKWYEYRPTLQATPGAPLQAGGGIVSNDGVQGRILNDTPYAIVVRSFRGGPQPINQAVLLPGQRMPYQLESEGTLQFYRYNGDTDPSPPLDKSDYFYTHSLSFSDPFFVGDPTTSFGIPGRSGVNVRSYNEGDSHYEVWGDTTFWVKRENDGWKINASQAFLDRYPDPNTFGTSDWAIFTIHIDSLAANNW